MFRPQLREFVKFFTNSPSLYLRAPDCQRRLSRGNSKKTPFRLLDAYPTEECPRGRRAVRIAAIVGDVRRGRHFGTTTAYTILRCPSPTRRCRRRATAAVDAAVRRADRQFPIPPARSLHRAHVPPRSCRGERWPGACHRLETDPGRRGGARCAGQRRHRSDRRKRARRGD